MPRGIFSTPEHEHRVVLAAGDLGGGQGERRATAGAPRLDVDDRHAGEPERGEHLVAGRDAAVDRAAERGLEAAALDAGVARARRAPPRRRAR